MLKGGWKGLNDGYVRRAVCVDFTKQFMMQKLKPRFQFDEGQSRVTDRMNICMRAKVWRFG